MGGVGSSSLPQKAAEAALSACGDSGCKVAINTSECAALATTHDGKFVGGAARKTPDAAVEAALVNCQKTHAGECIIKFSNCRGAKAQLPPPYSQQIMKYQCSSLTGSDGSFGVIWDGATNTVYLDGGVSFVGGIVNGCSHYVNMSQQQLSWGWSCGSVGGGRNSIEFPSGIYRSGGGEAGYSTSGTIAHCVNVQ